MSNNENLVNLLTKYKTFVSVEFTYNDNKTGTNIIICSRNCYEIWMNLFLLIL